MPHSRAGGKRRPVYLIVLVRSSDVDPELLQAAGWICHDTHFSAPCVPKREADGLRRRSVVKPLFGPSTR